MLSFFLLLLLFFHFSGPIMNHRAHPPQRNLAGPEMKGMV